MNRPLAPAPASFRELCLHCRRARSACWCAAVTPVDPGMRVVVLQHPGEARNPIGTARMAHLALRGSALLGGVRFEEDNAFRALVDDPTRHVAVLYPSPHALAVAALRQSARPLTLIAIDGTWSEARSIWNKNPSLRKLPAIRLAPAEPSRYRIRREPEAHCLSTIEALTTLLREMHGPSFDTQALLRPFDTMVEHQLKFIDAGHPDNRAGRHKPRPQKAKRTPHVAPELTAFGRHLVVVHGESNGFASAHPDGGGKVALTQWLALRPDTGETFHALVQPPAGLAPHALERIELDEETFSRAVSVDVFREQWAAFAEPLDVLCSWAFYSLILLRAAGADVPRYVNLHGLANERARRRLGKIEAAHAALCVPVDTTPSSAAPTAPTFPGRGGRR